MVSHRFRNSVISSNAFHKADYGSDHVPVISEIRVKLERLKQLKKISKLQVHLLKTNSDMKEKFCIKVQNRFETLDGINEITKAEELWEQMKSSILVSAEEILLKAELNKKRWMTDDILQLMEQRRLKKSNSLEYKLIDNEIKKKCSGAKEK